MIEAVDSSATRRRRDLSGASRESAAVAPALARPMTAGWLRSPVFDVGFIGGTAALALLSGCIVTAKPDFLAIVVLVDLWGLAYHHVIASYTRLCFDRTSFRQYHFLVLGLFPLVLLATALLAAALGHWIISTVYLYWQWFHYTRQSFGVGQVYRRKSGGLAVEDESITKFALYLLPLWGILHRSAQAPETFLGLELRVIPTPDPIVDLVGAAALAALAVWALVRARAFWQGRGPVAHTLYMISHFAIFAVGYLAIDDITRGWLVMNVWHNAQYVLFVWLFNSNRFRSGVDPSARFLSTLSQARNWWLYFMVCVSITAVVYLAIDQGAKSLAFATLPVALVAYQAINFHHYIVDAVIWKVHQPPLQKVLGLARG
jgi:hypothetical protein